MYASTAVIIAAQGRTELVNFLQEALLELLPIIIGATVLFAGIFWLKRIWHRHV